MTNLSPSEILDLDAPSYDALLVAVNERWTQNEELMAQMVEMTHAIYVSGLAQSGVKKLPDPYRVQRPWEEAPEPVKPKAMTFSQFALSHGKGHTKMGDK